MFSNLCVGNYYVYLHIMYVYCISFSKVTLSFFRTFKPKYLTTTMNWIGRLEYCKIQLKIFLLLWYCWYHSWTQTSFSVVVRLLNSAFWWEVSAFQDGIKLSFLFSSVSTLARSFKLSLLLRRFSTQFQTHFQTQFSVE